MDDLEVCYLPVVDMAEAIKTKKLSPVEVIDAILSRIEGLNPKVNAYCTLVAESARKQAVEAEAMVMKGEELGPIHGIPVSIKDLIFTSGIRTTGGSMIYENFVPDQDAIVVERLKAAGAIVIGKTNTPEFGFKGVTDNRLFGATCNPWNPGYTSGGSSGGAAASVAAGMGPLAIGTDGGGSIRIPSCFCGVFGFKPSYGRVPKYPGFPAWETLSHNGPITRTVSDAALALEVIAGRDDRDRSSLPDTGLRYLPALDKDLKGLKIAWSPDLGYATVDPQVLAITATAAGNFANLGSVLETASPGVESPGVIFSTIWGVSYSTIWQDKLVEWRDKMDPGLVAMVERGKDRLAAEYGRACLDRVAYWDKMRAFFEEYDLLLTPTLAVPPFELGSSGPDGIAGARGPIDWVTFTYPFNLTGQPAASVPCGWTKEGLPVGLQIVGRRFDDATVLKAAAAFERVSPWTDRRPPLD